jgi:hypothetical protein
VGAKRAHTKTSAAKKQTPPSSHRDNLRGFFEHCFPGLIKRIFGYDDFEQSWLAIVSKVLMFSRDARRRRRASHAVGA